MPKSADFITFSTPVSNMHIGISQRASAVLMSQSTSAAICSRSASTPSASGSSSDISTHSANLTTESTPATPRFTYTRALIPVTATDMPETQTEYSTEYTCIASALTPMPSAPASRPSAILYAKPISCSPIFDADSMSQRFVRELCLLRILRLRFVQTIYVYMFIYICSVTL